MNALQEFVKNHSLTKANQAMYLVGLFFMESNHVNRNM
ncbi:hypothetical protein PAGL106935_15645 [Paenibacillus glucanolyticus]